MKPNQSEIATFYQNKSVLITGATGLLGKAVLEKILRSCPLVNRVYILIRKRRGCNGYTRLSNLKSDSVFDTLRLTNPDALGKIIAIPGDIALPRLGISSDQWTQLCNDVSIVIHSAATVKFNETLKIAVELNVHGTGRVIELCKELKHLQALVYVSSAYANCDRKQISEVVYPLPSHVTTLLTKIDAVEDSEMEAMTKTLVNGRPNTYTYTKALAENILKEEAGNLPICIVRPSIITGAWREPTPGWIYGTNGLSGLVAAWSEGLTRTILCDSKKIVNWIPVDICANLILASAHQTAKTWPTGITVYNCCSGRRNPITYGETIAFIELALVKHPGKKVFPRPSISATRYVTKHSIHAFFAESLPAQILDMGDCLKGKGTRMRRICRTLQAGTKANGYFATREWDFATDNVANLYNGLTDVDKREYNFDVNGVEWGKYFENFLTGVQRFILKEA